MALNTYIQNLELQKGKILAEVKELTELLSRLRDDKLSYESQIISLIDACNSLDDRFESSKSNLAKLEKTKSIITSKIDSKKNKLSKVENKFLSIEEKAKERNSLLDRELEDLQYMITCKRDELKKLSDSVCKTRLESKSCGDEIKELMNHKAQLDIEVKKRQAIAKETTDNANSLLANAKAMVESAEIARAERVQELSNFTDILKEQEERGITFFV